MPQPSYIRLYETGRLNSLAAELSRALKSCSLCPWKCGVDRISGNIGKCGLKAAPVVSSFGPHFGEEPPLVKGGGSGTTFMTGCNLGCVFCQNYDISRLRQGSETSPEELAGMMISLQRRGCSNINFVTPTHQIAAIVEALALAVPKGLEVPLVYNSGGYDSAETLKLIEGVFDVYMPDFKYGNDAEAKKYSGPVDYVDRAKEAVKEMHRQTGDLTLDARGAAVRGLIVRHLVLPSGVSGTREVARFISKEISRDTYINIMDQYRPVYEAHKYSAIKRRITEKEFDEALTTAKKEGLRRFA